MAMICPVCRSQNLETAKFCGNCGSPFPRSNTPPSSSLLNCTQGHVYSAVYEHCPYCPQSDAKASSDFATRIESPEAEIETTQPSMPAVSARTEKMRRDYATLIESEAGLPTFTDPITGSPTADTFIDPTAPTQSPFDYQMVADCGACGFSSIMNYFAAFLTSPLIETSFLDDWLKILPNTETTQQARAAVSRIIDRERHEMDFDVSIKATLIIGQK